MKRRVFAVEQPGRLEALLRQGLALEPAAVRALVARGAVYLNGRRCADAGTRIGPGQKVLVVLEEGGASVTAPAAAPEPLRILFEDDDVLVLDKPPGVTAQPTAGRVGDSLLDLASAHLGSPAGLVHRLDKETSGVTVFGKHAEATARLAAAFREGRAKKEYLAATAPGLPAAGTIDLPLSKDPSRPGRWRATRRANGVPALTRYQRLFDGPVSLVALFPETGRTHQLRAHLAALGHPIVGDRLYGGPEGPRCLLHARRLTIDGATYEARIPADLSGLAPHATTFGD